MIFEMTEAVVYLPGEVVSPTTTVTVLWSVGHEVSATPFGEGLKGFSVFPFSLNRVYLESG